MTQDNGIEQAPIGVFDSGFGGLTILRDIRRVLPQYDYLFVGDNARAPYGTRSRELVYEFTLQAVKHLFGQGCHLVILACNTASAKALPPPSVPEPTVLKTPFDTRSVPVTA